MIEKIRVKFYDSDELAEIVFEDNKIDIISADSKMKESLEECLESWKKNFDLHGEKLFRSIPWIASRYSRIFFSGIEKD